MVAPSFPAILFCLLGLAGILFLWLYVGPGVACQWRLSRLTKAIPDKVPEELSALNELFAHARLSELWTEYSASIHDHSRASSDRTTMEVWLRTSSIPAEAVFTREALVDTKIHTEGFKHLPGICTGLGIIGTFGGLLAGLQTFTVSDEPSLVRKSLTDLMLRVHDAFVVSVTAIGVATAVPL